MAQFWNTDKVGEMLRGGRYVVENHRKSTIKKAAMVVYLQIPTTLKPPAIPQKTYAPAIIGLLNFLGKQ